MYLDCNDLRYERGPSIISKLATDPFRRVIASSASASPVEEAAVFECINENIVTLRPLSVHSYTAESIQCLSQFYCFFDSILLHLMLSLCNDLFIVMQMQVAFCLSFSKQIKSGTIAIGMARIGLCYFS